MVEQTQDIPTLPVISNPKESMKMIKWLFLIDKFKVNLLCRNYNWNSFRHLFIKRFPITRQSFLKNWRIWQMEPMSPQSKKLGSRSSG